MSDIIQLQVLNGNITFCTFSVDRIFPYDLLAMVGTGIHYIYPNIDQHSVHECSSTNIAIYHGISMQYHQYVYIITPVCRKHMMQSIRLNVDNKGLVSHVYLV